jgi:Fungal specific transcription factor domain
MGKEMSGDVHYLHEGYSGHQAPAFATGDLVEISHTWYETAIRELGRSNFFSKPQLSTVQALAILGLLHRNFGEIHREYFLLGLAINVARTLGLDHLGQEGSTIKEPSNTSRWNERADREVGRRLWWTLVICDW